MKIKKFIGVIILLLSCSLYSQTSFGPSIIKKGTFLGESTPLRDLPVIEPESFSLDEINVISNNLRNAPKTNQDALPLGPDPLANSSNPPNRRSNGLLTSFDGISIGEAGNSVPPDPTGAVGPNHYVHAVNTGIEIYDKSGNTLSGPVRLGQFFMNSRNDGDPIVMYDQLADRWFVSQFFRGSIEGLLIGVSTGSDPTGTYNLYQFDLDDFPDYPHYTVWPNGYYLTANKFTGNTTYVLDRNAMINGEDDPTIIGFNLPGVVRNPNTVFSPEPANLLGSGVPDTTPGLIVYLQDDAWGQGITFDHLKVWSITPNFAVPPASNISAPQIIPTTAPFDSTFAPFGEGDVFQPGSNQKLDNLGGVINYMANYRRFTTHNSFLVSFSVDIDGFDTSGIRWIELRNNGVDPFTIFQEGTHSVPDGDSRFLGSMGMDEDGNIALAYNIAGFSEPAGIRFTGRLAGDPLGRMSFQEEIIQAGVGIQEGFDAANRFGDYAQLTMDPDGETFWHTAQYFSADNFWTTRIASFNLDNLTLGIDDVQIDNSNISIYPQGTDTYEINLTTDSNGSEYTFEVVDIQGRKITGGNMETYSSGYKASFNSATLAYGVYAAVIKRSDNSTVSKKFLIN